MHNDGMSLKKRIIENEVTLGSWLQIGHSAVMESMASFPFDWLTVDLEHSDITIETFTEMVRSADIYGIDVFARVKENSSLDIRQVLDMGAKGVIVPLISSKEEAEKAVSSAKYAPDGTRGFAFCRANAYGRNFDDYVAEANKNTIVIVMIETKKAIENIEEILQVKGVDGVMIGPYDLSGSFGIPGETGSESMKQAMSKVVRACNKFNKIAGIHIVIPDKKVLTETIQKGYRFIALGMDNVFLSNSINSTLLIAEDIIKKYSLREKK